MKNGMLLIVFGWVMLALVIVKCGKSTPPNPDAPVVTPVGPVNPDQPLHYRGFKKPAGHGLHAGAPFMLADRIGNLPVKFNWADAGMDIPVKNQSSCGSCWAFSSVENMEWAEKIFLGKSLVLAPQSLVGQDFYGCGGGEFDGQAEIDRGLPLEKDCPYQANNSNCPISAPVAAKALSLANIGDGNNSPTVIQLKEALMQFGPLSVSVAATNSWDSYSGGVKKNCGGTQIDHMTVIYGWDDSISGGVWYMRNSWGSGWGDKGNMVLPYGCDSIGSDAATVLVKPIGTRK